MFFIGKMSIYGDLYKMSNLAKFKIEIKACGNNFLNKDLEGGNNLFLLGDSFLGRIMGYGMIQNGNSSDFKNINNINYVNWKDKIIIPKLNKKSRNILIIETVERYSLSPREFNNIEIDNNLKKVHIINNFNNLGINKLLSLKAESLIKQILFFDPFSMYIKDIKAELNYNLFDKLNDEIVISDDKEYLFYNQTINSLNSSFNDININKIDNIVENYNLLYSYYKNIGFDEVYITIIPNKVSIVSPNFNGKTYNHLIEKIRDSKKIKFPFIDMYTELKKVNKVTPVYYNNDTHWNCKGMNTFIEYVNKYIIKN
ncbi:MAG: hypothetical protein AABZ74_04860 [Cyanobacteriota bacterium]